MFKCNFETDNAAFDDAPASETARKIEQGDDLGGGPIHDVNGNRVGYWELTPYGRGPRRIGDTR